VTTAVHLSPSDLTEARRDETSLRAFLQSLPGVDKVGLEARAASLATRSIKNDSKAAFIDLAIRMVDLTTLEGADTPGKVQALCAKAISPDPLDQTVPKVAAVCVYGDRVGDAIAALGNSGIHVAAVATAFPSGRASLNVKLMDTKDAVDAGAHEIDMVIDRGAFLSGRIGQVYEEIVAVKAACGSAHLKVILETGELQTHDNIKRASWIAMLAGADFIKTSTGKINPAATAPVVLQMLEACRDWKRVTGEFMGMKPAGGIRTTKDAMKMLVLVHETVGDEWLTPDLFRIGASTLLNDLLMQRQKMRDGHYSGPRYVTND
jgi:deoxyribose-phosphate aldolase